MSTVNNPSQTDAAAIEAAKKQAAEDKKRAAEEKLLTDKEVNAYIDKAKGIDGQPAEGKAKEKALSNQDAQNIEKISKNPQTVAKMNELLSDPVVQHAFVYSAEFRNTLLSNAASATGLSDNAVKDFKKLVESKNVQDEIAETKETLKRPEIKNMTEEQKKFFAEEDRIDGLDEEKRLIPRFMNIAHGALFSGDRVVMTQSLASIVGMGASMGKFGKFGGAFQLLSGFFGKQRFLNYISLDFNNTYGNGNSTEDRNKTLASVQSGKLANDQILAMMGNIGNSGNA